ncbi:putative transcription factor & chromatin remodeling ARID family [Helianthus annuus]|uniref:Transcription factor & chromatin remodeling ARID family n=1 Tax=Helianthus annuus TaxID=4232 RepID=A0A9K3I3M3_HELAN|nr:putative transcription factor & chromatin remodeling ARID family [Helianthus annuus]KAJ0532497.1 putative transcription factor & chromatin remodeling ARID family [Helianthus annuus]KAJ0540970.1 putative transcription factor & chromatin remodeling ARID family [Helianthus annuus]KAJ0886496.1 putative transcription factor & chromatin remodeling ARID family [Helianthus annuus]
MIVRAIEFHDFSDCKSLLDMLEDAEFALKYKHELEIKLEEMVKWFLINNLGITTRSAPSYTEDNKKIDILGLHMVVKRDGGHRIVTSNNTWAVVAKDIGFDYNDGELMRIAYAMYLDVLENYYKFKSVQEKAIAKDAMKKDEGPSTTIRGRCRRDGDVLENDEQAARHYALFAGGDWHGMKKWQKRRRFDFKQAAKALDEANNSVLKHSLKLN